MWIYQKFFWGRERDMNHAMINASQPRASASTHKKQSVELCKQTVLCYKAMMHTRGGKQMYTLQHFWSAANVAR